MAFLPKAARIATADADVDHAEAEVPAATGFDSAAAVLARAQQLHDEYVAEGKAKRDELVSEGAAKHDELVAEADELVAEATAEHERLITEARERSAGMVIQAKQERTEVLEGLGRDRVGLEKEIEELQTFERGHRAPLKSYIEEQLVELEQTGLDDTTGK
jgi:polyhydroxyalkanoate synthesis regulator phasin